MHPSYEQLLDLNPRLRQKSKAEVLGLMKAIRECGYEWHPHQQVFFHPGLSRSVRTQGLDVFTEQRFREAHEKQLQEVTSHPEAVRLADQSRSVISGCGCPLFGAMILWGAFGWTMTGWSTWLLTLGGLVAAFVIVYGSSMLLAKRSYQARIRGQDSD